MVLSTGYHKIRTAVFISGAGSNLKSLIKFSKNNLCPISIKFIVSSNSKAKGLDYAKLYKIKKKVINFKDKNLSEKQLLSILKINNIEMICLAGFMKILSKKFVDNYRNRILNIHPSLLPKYKGLNTHKKVILNKEKFTGCTVHIVNSKLDSGKIILQRKIKVLIKDDEKTLAKRLLKIENKVYPKAIMKYISANL